MIPSAATKPLIFLLIALVFIIFLVHNDTPVVEKERIFMGTMVQIKAPVPPGGNSKDIGRAIDSAFVEIARVEGVFSVYKSDSEISKINRLKKGELLKISAETFGLIEKSLKYSKITGGAFDITVKPLVNIWAKAKVEKKLPLPGDIRDAVAKVGSNDIVLDKAAGTISFKKEGMAIDLGGVAKGYATDRAIIALKGSGVKDAIVNSGGDLYCMGRRSAKRSWTVGIQHPRSSGKIFLELQLTDKAVDTSGDYEKYFMLDGKRYSHIIDPRTGYPIGDGTVSASVIAGDSTTADILATALCVLGAEGLNIIDINRGEDAVIVIKKDGKMTSVMTTGLTGRYDVKKKSEL